MAFAFDQVERIVRRVGQTRPAPRDEGALPFVDHVHPAGSAILLDTCTYIDRGRKALPAAVRTLIGARITNHSTVALQELLFGVGRLDPRDSRSSSATMAIETMVRAIPLHRLSAPDIDVLGRAAVYAGVLSRTQGYAKDDRRRALADCTLFLQGMKHGLTVLTRNIRDFDLMLQLVPTGRVLFYRT